MADREWEAARRLCDDLVTELDEIAAATTDRIRSDFPDYALVTLADHREAVREQLLRRLVSLRDQRAWGVDDLEQAMVLAQRRARQGVPADVLICAYHVGDRELWRRITASSGGSTEIIPELTSLMLESMQAISTALVSAHSSVARAQHGARVTVAQRLLDMLPTAGGEAEPARLAAFLGFDSSGGFVAMALRPAARLADSHQVQGIVDRLGRRAIHAQLPHDQLLLMQGLSPLEIEAAARDLGELGLVGVGAVGPGIRGAAMSIEQARLAVTSASVERPVSTFGERWLESCATSRMDLLATETAHAVEIARAQEHLASTVIQFAETDMSVAQCARAGHLHVNTVVYRLERWRQLTGWNPRSFKELSMSVAACAFARRPGEPTQP